jgi:hypothetical protein
VAGWDRAAHALLIATWVIVFGGIAAVSILLAVNADLWAYVVMVAIFVLLMVTVPNSDAPWWPKDIVERVNRLRPPGTSRREAVVLVIAIVVIPLAVFLLVAFLTPITVTTIEYFP